MTAPTILVAGLGRCGSSLVMQMLDVAGVPTIGRYPDFEDDVNLRLPNLEAQREFTERCAGRAVKLIDPHLHGPPIGLEYRTIFLTRHPLEQAKSMLKLIGARNDRRARRAMETSVRRDTMTARQAVARLGAGEFYHLPFENIIHDPVSAANRIARFLDLPAGNGEKMARVVRRRPPTCLPYLLELELLSHA